MQIRIDARELDKVIKDIERLQRQIPKGIARGLNEGGDKVRTQVQHALQTQAGFVRYSSVTARTRTARAFADQSGGASYRIFVSGRKSRPFEFKTQVKKGPGGGVTVYMWNVAHRFPRSFEGSGKIAGLLEMRKGEARFPVRTFDGPNLAKEAVKGEAERVFFATAETEVPNAVLKHLAKIL